VSSLAEPESPASNESVTEDKEQNAGNGLTLEGPPFGLEKIYDYEPGGHHPVHLNDCLGNEHRYKVIHKLGNGGFANVWLCRDLKGGSMKYVAVKILMAESSTNDCGELWVNKFKGKGLYREIGGKHICLPLDQFQIDGPNGLHLCFVYPVLGPRVSYIDNQSENPDRDLREISHQVVQGMSSLHRHGICHGGWCFFFIPYESAGWYI
jgi:serine/threonine-protein kinase SRPK3